MSLTTAICSDVRFRLLSLWMFRFWWDHRLPCGINTHTSGKGPFSAWFQSETIIYIMTLWNDYRTTLVLIPSDETTRQLVLLLHQWRQSIVRSSDAAERKWFPIQFKQKSNQQREHVRVPSAHHNLVNVSFPSLVKFYVTSWFQVLW